MITRFGRELTLEEELEYKLIGLGEEEVTEPKIVGTKLPIYLLTLRGTKVEEDKETGVIKETETYETVPVLKDPKNRDFLLLAKFLKDIATSRNKGKYWKQYYEFVEYFAELEYAYAVNTYVVQGDTYDKAFVNLRDILTVKPINAKQKMQSFYTAVSRAKEQVQILL